MTPTTMVTGFTQGSGDAAEREIVVGKVYGGRTRVKRPRRVLSVENGRVYYVNPVTGETGVSKLSAFAHWAGRLFREQV